MRSELKQSLCGQIVSKQNWHEVYYIMGNAFTLLYVPCMCSCSYLATGKYLFHNYVLLHISFCSDRVSFTCDARSTSNLFSEGCPLLYLLGLAYSYLQLRMAVISPFLYASSYNSHLYYTSVVLSTIFNSWLTSCSIIYKLCIIN